MIYSKVKCYINGKLYADIGIHRRTSPKILSAKHRETKQFFTLYNTLNDKHIYLNKELGLLTSISDNYPEAMASPASKEQFVQQMEEILHGIEVNKSKVKKKLDEEVHQRDALSRVKLDLVELGRQYVAAYKQVGIEAAVNESLVNQLRNISSVTQT